jgi:hypothetical protein
MIQAVKQFRMRCVFEFSLVTENELLDISERDMKCPSDGPSHDRTDPATGFSDFGVLSKDVHGISGELFLFQSVEPAGPALEAISKLIRAAFFRSQSSLFVSRASHIPKWRNQSKLRW